MIGSCGLQHLESALNDGVAPERHCRRRSRDDRPEMSSVPTAVQPEANTSSTQTAANHLEPSLRYSPRLN